MSVNLGRVAFVAKGSYNAATTYQQYDYVTHNNGSYVYISPIPAAGKPVTDAGYWQPLIDPAGMNNATAAADTAATKAETNAQTAATAAETANTAAAAADEARQNIQSDLAGKAPAIYVDAISDLVHITDGAEGMPVKSLITHIVPIETGEGEKSPANPWVISGRNKVSLTGAGQNLIPMFSTNTTVSSASGYSGPTVPIGNRLPHDTPLTIRLFFADGTELDTSGTVFVLVDANGNAIKQSGFDGLKITLTEAEAKQITAYRVYFNDTGAAATLGKTIANVQLTNGDVQESVTYQGQTLTADLPETVYGGDKNWTTGELENYGHKLVIDGTNIAVAKHESANGVYVIYNIGAYGHPLPAAGGMIACSHFPAGEVNANNVHVSPNSNGTLYLGSIPGINDAAAYNAWLANNPITCVYRVADPETIQLTPQQLSTLKGTNNIWSNTGATEVTYAADTKLYADGKDSKTMIAPVEHGMVASRNYNIGDLFAAQNTLYRATVAIASGETIVPGSNCKETTVAENLGGGGGSGGNYVLPIASADTLGGVKVGEGLQMEGEFLSVQTDTTLKTAGQAADAKAVGDALSLFSEGMVKSVNGVTPDESGNVQVEGGASGQFELIEEFTLEADMMSILRTHWPDGTEYNLKSIIFRFKAPEAGVSQNVGGWIKLNSQLSSSEWVYIAPGMFVQTDKAISHFVYIQNSDKSVTSYYGYSTYDANTSYTSGTSYNVIENNRIRFGTRIFDAYAYSNEKPIPAGTKVTIWGVRADA